MLKHLSFWSWKKYNIELSTAIQNQKKYQTADFPDKIIFLFVLKCNFQLWHMIGTVFELMTELSLFASLLEMMMSYLFWFWLQQRRTCSNWCTLIHWYTCVLLDNDTVVGIYIQYTGYCRWIIPLYFWKKGGMLLDSR